MTSATTDSTIARLAAVGWFQVDANRIVTAVSPEMEAITGFSPAETIGQSCIGLIRCPQCLRGCSLFRNGRVDATTLSIYRKDGTPVDVVRAGEVIVEDGQVVGAVETVRLADAGERSVDSPAEPLETVLASLGRMFIVADANLKVMIASTDLAAQLGMTAAEVVGVSVERIFGANLFGAGGSLREAASSGARREGIAAEFTTVRGQRVPVSISIGPISPDTHCGGTGARTAIMIRPADSPEHSGEAPAFEGIVGRSPVMQRIFRLIDLLNDNDATVLVTGESGTGKEMVARALHARSGRRGAFVAVNCAALPGELLESELFGHVRGAFTGAVRDRPGRFEVADHGTLFLDEIGDMPLALQAKLLRVLQDHAFERVGDSKTRTVDVRVIAATHIDLAGAVAEKRFREDLFYRLRVVPIHVPPLRERREDLVYLIPHLLARIGVRRGRSLRLAPAALEALVAADWPGNVRELENALEYATALCDGQTIHFEHLPQAMTADAREPSRAPADLAAAALTAEERAERMTIAQALAAARYRRDEAARALGFSRSTLWRKMKQYRL